MLPETHAQQRQAFRDFVAALLVVRTGGQATLARTFANCEAARRRLTRWVHNPRVEPQAQARAHAQAGGAQLPLSGTVRSARAWTTEDPQPLWVAALSVGRRAVPVYGEASTTGELQGPHRARAHAFVRQGVEQEVGPVARERRRLTAARGVCQGAVRARRARWPVPVVVRLPAHVTGCLHPQWQKLGRLSLTGPPRRRALGHRWWLRSTPPRWWVVQARARNKKGRGEYWPLVSTRPRSAVTLAQESARRFGGEAGFREAQPGLGFAQARMAEIEAWARLVALVAAALLLLPQLGTPLLRHPQRQSWLRQVRSRRRARSDLSGSIVVCHLLDQATSLWDRLNPYATLNLEAAL